MYRVLWFRTLISGLVSRPNISFGEMVILSWTIEKRESIFPLVRYKNQFTGIDIVYKLWIIDQLKRFFEQIHHCSGRLLLSAMIRRRSF